jgi:hypothetical protein
VAGSCRWRAAVKQREGGLIAVVPIEYLRSARLSLGKEDAEAIAETFHRSPEGSTPSR